MISQAAAPDHRSARDHAPADDEVSWGTVTDATIISDVHLGADNCEAKLLCSFLEETASSTRSLILNGDVIESLDFRRLRKHHWHVLSLLRKLSKRLPVVWVAGNHDGPAEVISHLLGVEVVEDYELTSGDKRIFVTHGHKYDTFLDDHPILTWLGDVVYGLCQKLDRSHAFARLAKHTSKQYLRCMGAVQNGAIREAKRRGCDAVCCGHTHNATVYVDGVAYYNSGCWTERPCSYLEVADGNIVVKRYGAELEVRPTTEIPQAEAFATDLRMPAESVQG